MTRWLPTVARSTTRIRLASPPTYWRCEPSWSWRSRPLPEFLLWLVLDGTGTIVLNGRHAELRPGFLAMYAPGDAPTADHDPEHPLLVFGMHFTVQATDDADPPAPDERWCRLHDQALAAELARRCDAAHRAGDPFGERQAELALAQLLCLLWDGILRPRPTAGDAMLDEVVQMIRREPSRRWTVPELSHRAGLSPAQFTRRFTDRVGTSPARYLVRTRMRRAEQLLSETTMSVTQIARALGYSDVGYFSRQYKQHTGRPPSTDR